MLNKYTIQKKLDEREQKALASIADGDAVDLSSHFYGNSRAEAIEGWGDYLIEKPIHLLQEHTSYVVNPIYDLPLYKLYRLHP
ncbi:MAG: hypothetical protein LUC37_01835 [Prevotella sp.]|nr:hypothetical protein [Prevotella sp.]